MEVTWRTMMSSGYAWYIDVTPPAMLTGFQGCEKGLTATRLVEPFRLLQARRRSRAAAIQDATEGPRPQPEGPQKEAPVGDPSELLTPLSNLPLSPLSSMGLDLSAEPLSPTTTAALQILRERGFPQAANSAGFVADEAGVALDPS